LTAYEELHAVAPETECELLAVTVNQLLLEQEKVLVLAESCTAGLIAATIARFPGASRILAGSAVVYQIPTKCQWIDVSQKTINEAGVVSADVAIEMACGVLKSTPHATCALSITGHLGPDAPPDLDGVAWMAMVFREDETAVTLKVQLDENIRGTTDATQQPVSLRIQRQSRAVTVALQFIHSQLAHRSRDCTTTD
jgi:nicotinamide-nucleotide amidase